MPIITNVSVQQIAGAHLVVLTALSAEYTQGPTAVGVLVMAPLTLQNGGPQQGPFGPGNMYNINGTQGPNNVQIPAVRYIGQSPAGNAQFTTE